MAGGAKFSIGIEEEYLLVDPDTRALANTQPPEFMARCKERLGGRVTHEFLQSQVEIGTSVCATVGEARHELRELRTTVAETAREFGMRMIAASTHPWAHWRERCRSTWTATASSAPSIRASPGGWRSAGCTSMPGSRTRTCAST